MGGSTRSASRSASVTPSRSSANERHAGQRARWFSITATSSSESCRSRRSDTCWRVRLQASGRIARARTKNIDVLIRRWLAPDHDLVGRAPAGVRRLHSRRFWPVRLGPVPAPTSHPRSPRETMAERNGDNTGRIVEIKGVVIDAVFPERLPEILTALEIEVEHGTLVAEVQQHLGDDRVRAVAMDSTDGLARG